MLMLMLILLLQAVDEDETTVLIGGQKCYNTIDDNSNKGGLPLNL